MLNIDSRKLSVEQLLTVPINTEINLKIAGGFSNSVNKYETDNGISSGKSSYEKKNINKNEENYKKAKLKKDENILERSSDSDSLSVKSKHDIGGSFITLIKQFHNKRKENIIINKKNKHLYTEYIRDLFPVLDVNTDVLNIINITPKHCFIFI